MYKLIGGDKEEYGPVSAEQLRIWIAEGRLNAQSLIQAEGSTEWRALSSFPEFADALVSPAAGAGLPATGLPGEPLSEQALLEQDYDLDIGSCISRAWTMLKAHFWPIVGISLPFFLVLLVINAGVELGFLFFYVGFGQEPTTGQNLVLVALSMVTAPIYVLLFSVLVSYYLQLIRSQQATLGTALVGLAGRWGQLALLGLATNVIGALAMVIKIWSMVGFCVCLLVAVYFYVSWIFALPLVVDQNLGFWEAMERSRKRVAKHWFLMFAFMLIFSLLASIGILACCIGILASIPLGYLTLLYAYEDIFRSKNH